MMFQDLRKKVLQNQQLQQQTKLSDLLYQKPFWIWDINEHIKEDKQTGVIVVLIISLDYQRRKKMKSHYSIIRN